MPQLHHHKLPWVVQEEPQASTSGVQLGPDHFLNQPFPDLASLKLTDLEDGALDISTLAAADFDVDVATGFLPTQPIPRLHGEYRVWEDLFYSSAPVQLCSSEAEPWRAQVRHCPLLPTINLKTTPQLRRAHVVLAFITHRYLHSASSDQVEPQVPKSVADPFIAVSERLDLPPVLTYADTVLWNWQLENPALGMIPENLKVDTTFTGTPSEDHFFLSSLFIELQGVLSLRLMSSVMDEVFVNDDLAQQRVASYLYSIAQNIDDLTLYMKNVKTDCDPQVFYHQIRPWFHAGPRIFELSDGSKRKVDLDGPSAGQSTLIHSLDVFFGIDHSPQEGSISHDDTFMNRMSVYMPHHHRLFLRNLGSKPSIRAMTLASPTDSLLRKAYNMCITAMRRLREAHTAVVFSHVVKPSRESKPSRDSSDPSSSPDEVVKGTGGTDVLVFLRNTRDRTLHAKVPGEAEDDQ